MATTQSITARPTADFGSHYGWARDFAFVGAATALVPALLGDIYYAGPVIWVPALVMTATLGAGVGVFVRVAVDHPLIRKIPLVVLAIAAAGLGAIWGGAAGGAATALAGVHSDVGVWIGATAGLVQLSWFIVPYTWCRLRGCGATAVLLLAMSAAPLIGTFAFEIYG